MTRHSSRGEGDGRLEFINIGNELRDKARLAAVVWDDALPWISNIEPGQNMTVGFHEEGRKHVTLTGSRGVTFEGFEPSDEDRTFWETASALRPWRFTNDYLRRIEEEGVSGVVSQIEITHPQTSDSGK